MCDYCDCRSHPQLASLSDEHETLLGLLSALDRAGGAGDDAAAAECVAELRDLLDRHAAGEERGVFVQLRAVDVDDRYVATFEGDHDRIHRLLDRCGSAGWWDAAASLVRELRAHITREETDLFPAAHQLLTPEHWDAVDEAMATQGAR